MRKLDMKNQPNFDDCIRDLMEDGRVQSMRGFMQHGDMTCYDHCMNVAIHSYRLCRWLGCDARSAARGALLHDYFLYDWHKEKPYKGLHGFHHPYIALKNARRDFELSEVEADIIVKHMWPLTLTLPRCKEALLVCLVDKYCAIMETLPAFRRFAEGI